MKRLAFLCFSLWAICAIAQNPYADWSGKLQVTPQQSLSIVFHINNDSGSDEATMDSPDQNAYGIPAKINHLSSDSVCLEIPQLMFTYSGKINGDIISGTLAQRGMKFPLDLKRGTPELNRPQTPKPPYPYNRSEVTVHNQSGVSALAGTLITPQNVINPDLVIMVTGSGLQNRDEECFGHRPFAVIADWLGRNGIASYRYDDRGFGESTGDATNATTDDLASDAKAVFNHFRNSGDFERIGILGHSEGGQIAYILGAGQTPPDFIISLAGPTVRGDSISAWQNGVSLKQANIDDKTREDFCNAFLKMCKFRRNNPEAECSDETLAEIYPQYADSPITLQLSQSIRNNFPPNPQIPWVNHWFSYSPANDLINLRSNALILFGEKDMQVPPSLCEHNARNLVKNVVVKVYPDLNHLMQHAVTGTVEEYRQIEETISQEVLDDILDFIKSQNR